MHCLSIKVVSLASQNRSDMVQTLTLCFQENTDVGNYQKPILKRISDPGISVMSFEKGLRCGSDMHV
jgi:hypothetical protein